MDLFLYLDSNIESLFRFRFEGEHPTVNQKIRSVRGSLVPGNWTVNLRLADDANQEIR
jgi:hypothetical protein